MADENRTTLVGLINDIADAIKTKLTTGAPDQMTLAEMPEYIDQITGGGETVTKDYVAVFRPYTEYNSDFLYNYVDLTATTILPTLQQPSPQEYNLGELPSDTKIFYHDALGGDSYTLVSKIKGVTLNPDDTSEITETKVFWSYGGMRLNDYTLDQLKGFADEIREGNTATENMMKGFIGDYKLLGNYNNNDWYITLMDVSHDPSHNEYLTFGIAPKRPMINKYEGSGTSFMYDAHVNVSTAATGTGPNESFVSSSSYGTLQQLVTLLELDDYVATVQKSDTNFKWGGEPECVYYYNDMIVWIPSAKELGYKIDSEEGEFVNDPSTEYSVFKKFDRLANQGGTYFMLRNPAPWANNVSWKYSRIHGNGFPNDISSELFRTASALFPIISF